MEEVQGAPVPIQREFHRRYRAEECEGSRRNPVLKESHWFP